MMLRMAARLPIEVGVKVILTVQLAFAASEVVHVVPDCEKSPAFAPLIVMPEIDKGVGRLFFRVTVLAGLVVPALRAANVSVDGVTGTGAIPVPTSVAD